VACVRYEKRRVLLRAGHPGNSCYFIYSGSVFVNIEEKASKTGKMYTKTLCVLPCGSMCGVSKLILITIVNSFRMQEISLLYGIPRSATVICRENVEAIVISKEVLLRLSPDKMQRDITLKMQYLRFENKMHAHRQMCTMLHAK